MIIQSGPALSRSAVWQQVGAFQTSSEATDTSTVVISHIRKHSLCRMTVISTTGKKKCIRSKHTKTNPLFWLRSVQQQSTLVIRWTTQAQIRQQTFTPTFLYLLDLRWVSVGFVALFFTVQRSERLGARWESCHFLAEVAAHVKKHVIPVYGQFGNL